MTIYTQDPIAEALDLEPMFDFYKDENINCIPEDAINTKYGIGGFMIAPDHIDEWKRKISNTLKKKNAEDDYWKVGVEAAANTVRGTSQSKEHKDKKAKAIMKEIEIEGILYTSGKDAAEKLGYSSSTISSWVKKNGSRYNINIPKGSNQYKKR